MCMYIYIYIIERERWREREILCFMFESRESGRAPDQGDIEDQEELDETHDFVLVEEEVEVDDGDHLDQE